MEWKITAFTSFFYLYMLHLYNFNPSFSQTISEESILLNLHLQLPQLYGPKPPVLTSIV